MPGVGRLRRWLSAALILAMGAAAAQAQGTVEATLIEVRVGQVASVAMRAEREGTRLWLPVAELAAAVELEEVSRSISRVTLRRWPSRDLLVFDADSGVVRIGTRTVTAPVGALRRSEDALLVDATTLQEVLRTQLEVSWSELVLAIPMVDSLPIGRRMARERSRARLAARGIGDDAGDVAPLARPLGDGAVLDYSFTAPLTGARRNPGWSTALGLDVLGGSLEVSSGGLAGGARLPTLSSWTGVWRTSRVVSQMRLGDGLGSGPQPRLGRGLMLTNAPYMRPSLFGLQTLRGELAPGWLIEAYSNGELVAVDTVGRGSEYQLQLPVLYGENPVDLIAVGPFGQTRALSENLRIAADLLPGGRSEYGVSMARCLLRQQCAAAATADLRVGLTDRWTMRLGLDALARDSVGWRQSPYFSFSGTPTRMLSLQLDAAAFARTRMAMNVEPSRQFRLSAERSWFSADPMDVLLASRRATQTSVYANWRSTGLRQSAVEASVDRGVFLDGGALMRARLSYGTQLRGVRMQPYLRHERTRGTSAQAVAGVEAMILPDPARGRYRGAALVRLIGEIDDRGRALREAVTLSMPMPGAFRADAGIAFQRSMRGPLATLAVSRDLNAFRSYTASALSREGSGVQQSVQGSALLARGASRPHFVSGPSLQRTGVTGIVFLDRDLDGRRDPGEPAVPGVTVQVGTGHARTDADGRYRVWDLVPFVPLAVVIDSTTLPSPLWIPTLRHTRIEAGPNRFEPVDIPLVAGGVLEGRVQWLRGTATSQPPVPLLVLDARGEVVAQTTSFNDGEFVLFGVLPGRLTVRVDPAWLAARRLQADAQRVSLASTDDGATARVPLLTIVPLTSVQQCVPGAGAGCGGGHDDLR